MKITSPLRFGVVVVCLSLCTGCTREAKRDRLLQTAATHFAAGDFEKARIEYQNVLQVDPKNTTALSQLAEVWLQRGAPLRALPYLLQLRAFSPDDRENHLKMLRIALGSGKLDEARKGALAILARSPGNAEALLLLSEAARSPADQETVRQTLRTFPHTNVAAFHLASANLALQQGNAAAAKISLQRALALEPKSPAPHTAMAAFQLLQKDPKLAAEELEAAAGLAPVRSNDRLRWFEFKARNGEMEDAVAGVKALAEKAPDYFPAWRCLAQFALHEKKYDEALEYLRKIFTIDPQNFEGRLVQAQVWLAQKDVKKGIAELERLAADFPGFAAPRYDLAQAHLQNNDPTQAIASLRQAVLQNPDHEQAILLLAALQLRAGEAQVALYSLVDLLTKRPQLEQAQLLLIDALGALGRLDDIARLAESSIAAAPDNARSHILLGLVLARQGNTVEARKALEKALALKPDALPVLDELIRLDLKEQDVATARRRVQTQLTTFPDSAAVYAIKSRVEVAAGKWAEAEALALRALEIDPVSAVAYDLLAKCHLARKDAPDFAQRLDAFVASHPSAPGALAMAGNVYLQAGQFAKARDLYEQHLKGAPDSIAIMNNLAYLYTEKFPNLDRALELAERARSLQPYSPEIADTLGWVLYHRKDYARALELLRDSAAKRPDNPEMQAHFQAASQMAPAQTQASTAPQPSGPAATR